MVSSSGLSPAHLSIAHHAPCLCGEHLGLVQFAGCCERTQFLIRRGFFSTIEECRRDEHSCDQHPHRGGVRQILFAQLFVKRAQLAFLGVAQCPAPCLRCKIEHGLHMLRLGFDEPLLEGFGGTHDRFAHRLEGLGLRILRGELPDLLEPVHLLQRGLADEVQLVPHAVQRSGLRSVEHQPSERLILAIEKRERDDLVHWDNLRVTARGGKQRAEIVGCSLEPPPCGAAVAHEDGRAV